MKELFSESPGLVQVDSQQLEIRDQVKSAGLPFMFKHWAGKNANSKSALLEGKIWDEYPRSLSVNMDWGDRRNFAFLESI